MKRVVSEDTTLSPWGSAALTKLPQAEAHRTFREGGTQERPLTYPFASKKLW